MLSNSMRRTMRRFLAFFIWAAFCYSAVTSARIEQFNLAQCAQLELLLEQNREQQRRGYTLKQELKIKGQQAQLELQLHHHCQQPADQIQPRTSASKRPSKNTAPAKIPRSRTTAAKTAGAAVLQISQIEVKAPYQGAKLAAWLQFYQAPFYCFGVRLTERIRQCVEQRQHAQQQFEQQYTGPGSGRISHHLSDQ